MRGIAKQLAITDPYRPEVATTTPNDVPFIAKSGEEFPAGRGSTQLRDMW